MITNRIYNLKSEPFGICSGIWDTSSNTFKHINSTEKNKCCLRTCEPTVRECHKLCPDAENSKLCELTCNDIQNSCIDYCQLSTKGLWGIDNPIYKATKEYNCGDGYYHPINQECLKENKNNIISSCQKHCIPTMDVGCSHHCQYSYGFISDPKNSFFSRIGEQVTENNKKVLQKSIEDPIEYKDEKYFVYIAYCLGVSVILVGLFLLLLNRK